MIPIELQLASFRLAFQTKEFQESDLINRFHTLLILDEQRTKDLEQIQKRKSTFKKYFDKKAKNETFKVGQEVILWDFAHADKGKHSKFYKLWIGP